MTIFRFSEAWDLVTCLEAVNTGGRGLQGSAGGAGQRTRAVTRGFQLHENAVATIPGNPRPSPASPLSLAIRARNLPWRTECNVPRVLTLLLRIL